MVPTGQTNCNIENNNKLRVEIRLRSFQMNVNKRPKKKLKRVFSNVILTSAYRVVSSLYNVTCTIMSYLARALSEQVNDWNPMVTT